MERLAFSSKCAWCGRVKGPDEWVFERRKHWSGYLVATCPHCRLLYSMSASKDMRFI